MERLMKDVSLYQKEEESGVFNNCYVTKLLRNYRYVSSPDQAGLMRPAQALWEKRTSVGTRDANFGQFC